MKPSPSESDESSRTNIGFRHFPFFGRSRELDEIRDLLRDHRLLTVLGEPGVGKSSLMRQYAQVVCPNLPGGKWEVVVTNESSPRGLESQLASDIAPVRNPALNASSALSAWFHNRPGLVLIDQADRSLLAAGELAAMLLESCPEATVLVASRLPLDRDPERRLLLGPMDLPNDYSGASHLAAFEGTRLFCDRMERLNFGWLPSLEDETLILELCRAMNGNPSAILFAASLSATQGLARTHRTFVSRGQSDGSNRDGNPWSKTSNFLGELDPALREQAADFVVFTADWSLEAAGFVRGHRDKTASSECLSRLSDVGLVELRFDSSGRARFSLSEQFVPQLELQVGPARRMELEARHADYYNQLVALGNEEMSGRSLGVGMARIAADYANIRLALCRSLAKGEEVALSLVSHLAAFWQRARPFDEAHDLALEGADVATHFPHSLWAARARSVAAGFLVLGGSYAEGEALGRLALEGALAADDALGASFAQANLALNRKCQGDLEAALAGMTLAAQDLETFQQPRRHMSVLINLGVILEDLGRHEEAVERFQQVIAMAQDLGDDWMIIRAETSLAQCYLHLDNSIEVLQVASKTLMRSERLLDSRSTVLALEYAAGAANRLDEPHIANLLFDLAQRIRVDESVVSTSQQHEAMAALEDELERFAECDGESHSELSSLRDGHMAIKFLIQKYDLA